MRNVTWTGITVASVEWNDQTNSTSICGTPWYFNVWWLCYRAFLFCWKQHHGKYLRVYKCALQIFAFTQVYNTEQGENCLNKTVLHPASVMKYEVWSTPNVPYTSRGSKEADKGRVRKEDQTPTSELFMTRFLRVRFAQRKTQNSVICETELAQVWWQSTRQCSNKHGKKLSTV